MKYAKILSWLIIVITGLLCQSCTKTETDVFVDMSKSTLIYMAADNNLDNYGVENIKELERGMPIDSKGYIFVFVDRSKGRNPSHPYLLQISRDTISESITSRILQSYKEQNSCDAKCLKQVIGDVEQYCYSLNTTLSRLVLWSHGSGWLPQGTSFESGKQSPVLFSFGLDEDEGNWDKGSGEMEITELSKALSGHHFEYLIMDACFMGTIETAYELKDSFDYMIMSPSEILSMGFPYSDIVCDLVSNDIKVQNIADKYFAFYANKKNAFCSATISVVNSKYLIELGQSMQPFYQKLLNEKMENKQFSFDKISQYDRTGSNYFFDFRQFISQDCDKAIMTNIANVWNKVLISYQHTEKMFSVLDLSKTSGLSIYIPNNYDEREKIHTYYKELRWAKDSGASLLFN